MEERKKSCDVKDKNVTFENVSRENAEDLFTHKPQLICLKTVQPFFQGVWVGIKTFEMRNNDRNFEVDDIVYLQEFDAEKQYFSGREIKVRILFLLKDFVGIEKGYCVFSFEILEKIESNEDLRGFIC